MSTHDLLAHLHLYRREEIKVFRKLDDNGAGQLGQIAGCGELTLIREAVDIREVRPGHAELLRRLVHARDKGVLAAGCLPSARS